MNKVVRRHWGAIALLLITRLAWAGPNVLLLWDDDEGTSVPDGLNAHTKSLIAALENAGINVTLPNHTQGKYTGSSPAPEGFDVVVHLNGGGQYSYILPNAGVNRLVFYVQSDHGGYVGSENNAAQMAIPPQFGGLSQDMWELTPIMRVRGWGDENITVFKIPGQENHPVLRNLPDQFTFHGGHKEGYVKEYVTDPATALMTDNDGNDAVAVREFGTGRVVGFHHTGNSSGSATLSDPKIQRLYVNAVLWADVTPPAVASITRLGNNPTNAAALRFKVLFSEGVTSIDAGDFAVATAGEAQSSSPLGMTAVSDREYTVQVNGVGGMGALGLNVVDNDSIWDVSANQNPLGGEGAGNGDYTGETYTVDRVAPLVTDFITDQVVVPLGGIPEFRFVFSESMDLGIPPAVSVITVSNGVITGEADLRRWERLLGRA